MRLISPIHIDDNDNDDDDNDDDDDDNNDDDDNEFLVSIIWSLTTPKSP